MDPFRVPRAFLPLMWGRRLLLVCYHTYKRLKTFVEVGMSEDATWEYAEIKIKERKRGLFDTRWTFIAEINGPFGVSTAAESDVFHSANHRYRKIARLSQQEMCDPYGGLLKACRAVQDITITLTTQGWEPQPPGSSWFSRRFRRRVGAKMDASAPS